jgi:hypothetical protein
MFCAVNAQAAVVHHTSDSSFNTAVSALTSLGTDSFTSTPGTMDGSLPGFNDPLTQGVATTPNHFPSGVSIPATFQSNVGDHDTLNPRGVDGLRYYNDIGGTWLYIGTDIDSMDIIPLVDTHALSWLHRSFGSSQDVTVRVYGQGVTPISVLTVSSPSGGGDKFVGIEMSAGETITRINVDNNGTGGYATLGLDYVSMYQRAGVFVHDNKTDFDNAVSGLNNLGVEDFENSALTSPEALAFNDSLTQGVANHPYPNGLTLPVTIQSNNSGSPSVLSRRVEWGLAQAETGFAGLWSAGILANYAVDGLDIIMLGDNVEAVSFNTIGYAADTVDIFFYDISGAFLGQAERGSDITGNNFVGFIAEDGDYIGRINIMSQNSLQQGIDNLRIYTPEPATMTMLALGGLAVLRRRRCRS